MTPLQKTTQRLDTLLSGMFILDGGLNALRKRCYFDETNLDLAEMGCSLEIMINYLTQQTSELEKIILECRKEGKNDY